MPKLLTALLLLLTLTTGAQPTTPDQVLDTLHRAASEADADTYFSLYTHDATFLGTDRRERWTRPEFERLYRPYMDSGRGWTYEVRDRDLRLEDGWAWFDETLWHETLGHCRGSGVLAKINGNWKIKQYNLTFPLPNEISKQLIDQSLADDATRLRALTFNIRYNTKRDGQNAWPNRARAAASLIARNAPDVIGIQEALWGQLQDLEKTLPGYKWVGVARDDGKQKAGKGEYAPIFYLADRFDLKASGSFWLSPTPNQPGSTGYGNNIPRLATWAELTDRLRDETILIVNTHFDHESAESRASSAEQLTNWIRQHLAESDLEEVIVLGDFNTPADSDETAALRSLGRPLAPRQQTYHAFKGPKPQGKAIDYIIPHGPDLEPRLVRALDEESEFAKDRYVSDHLPVMADFIWK